MTDELNLSTLKLKGLFKDEKTKTTTTNAMVILNERSRLPIFFYISRQVPRNAENPVELQKFDFKQGPLFTSHMTL